MDGLIVTRTAVVAANLEPEVSKFVRHMEEEVVKRTQLKLVSATPNHALWTASCHLGLVGHHVINLVMEVNKSVQEQS